MIGPNQSTKLTSSSKNHAFELRAGFFKLFRNICLVVLLSVSTWGMCTVLKLSVMLSTEYLFNAFHYKPIIASNPIVQGNFYEKIQENIHTHPHPEIILLGVLLAGTLLRSMLIRHKSWKTAEGDGASQSIAYFIENDKIKNVTTRIATSRYTQPTFVSAIKRGIITFLTLGCGGSGGLEGPIIPMGESIGSGWAKKFKVYNADDLRAFQMAGIAAAVCTLLNAPFASAIFAAEVVLSERIIYRTLLYSVFSVIVAFSLNTALLGQGKLFVITPHSIDYTLIEYLQIIFVAVFCSAPVGVGLSLTFKFFKKTFNAIPIMVRAPIGTLGIAVIVLGLWHILGIEPDHVLGMGEHTIEDIIYHTGNPSLQIWWVLLLIILAKTLTTGLTLMTGGSAGLLIPSMVLGGSMGAAVHSLLLIYTPSFTPSIELFVVSGIASALVSIIEVPISAILLIISMFGPSYAPPAMLSVAICYLLAKNLKLYLYK